MASDLIDTIREALELVVPFGAKAIPLTKGKFAIVDEADYDKLIKWK